MCMQALDCPKLLFLCCQVPDTHAESVQLLAETRAVNVLEAEYAADLDFGGISTSVVRFHSLHKALWFERP